MKSMLVLSLALSASAFAGDHDQHKPGDQCDHAQQQEVVYATCPNDTDHASYCTSNDGALSVTVCADPYDRDSHLIINGESLKARESGNYAAYGSFESTVGAMNYQFGFASAHPNGTASAFLLQTSTRYPFFEKATDLFCQLPF